MQDNAGMHILIPFAAPAGPDCQRALGQLQPSQLPHLSKLLRQLSPSQTLQGTPQDLNPTYERVQARSLGLPDTNGLIPWAARDAVRLGLSPANGTNPPDGWAWITPCHWKVNADHVEMQDPADLALTDDETTALMEAMQGYFAEDGIALHALSAGTWLAHGAVLEGLATASLERARGARIDTWMPRQPQAKTLRRLQNEMQMLLYTHPLNDTRAVRRQTTVNSFWVSGTGALPAPNSNQAAVPLPEPVTSITTLRAAALRDDAAAWLEAWHTLDRTVLATAEANTLTLTLSGEQQAITFAPATDSWLARMRRRFAAPSPSQLLATL
jgi:hypothetical protein